MFLLFYKQFDRLHNFRTRNLLKGTKRVKKSAFLCIFISLKVLTIRRVLLYNNSKSTCVYFVFAMHFIANSRRTHTFGPPTRIRGRGGHHFSSGSV